MIISLLQVLYYVIHVVSAIKCFCALIEVENERCDFFFVCFVLPILDGVIMDDYPIFWSIEKKYWMPIHMTPSKIGKTKTYLLFSFYLELSYLCILLA